MTVEAPPDVESAPSPRPHPDRSRRWLDAAAVAVYVAAAVAIFGRQWADPHGRTSANLADQALAEWFLSHSARWITHFENPLFSDRIGAPVGANIMANTSYLGLGIPLTPITLLFGASVTYLLGVTLALAGTAAGWYYLLSRQLVTSRAAAWVGGAFAGFSPGMLSQAQGHLQIVAQFLVPVILWRVLRLARTRRPVRDGVILGLLVVYQIFIGEEVLFLTALACLVAVVVYYAQHRDEVRSLKPALQALLTAAGVGLLLAGYPLAGQFLAADTYDYLPNIPFVYSADVLSFVHFSGFTLAGDPTTLTLERPVRYATNLTEMNSFYGWPLLLVTVGIVVWLRRSVPARVAAAVAVTFVIFSLGVHFTINSYITAIPAPWWVFHKLPVLEAVVPSRFSLVASWALAVLLALAVDKAVGSLRVRTTAGPVACLAAIAVALVPLTPRPAPSNEVPPIPGFFTERQWAPYVDGGTVLVIPPGAREAFAGMRWAADDAQAFRITNGYYLLRDPEFDDGRAAYFNHPTATERLLDQNRLITVTDDDRAQVAVDLHRREVDLVVLDGAHPALARVKPRAEALFGPARFSGGIWFWDVRAL